MQSADGGAAAGAAAADGAAGEDDERWAEITERWHVVRAFLRSLATIEPPIFPGPIPDRRAPRLARSIAPQLEPVRPGLSREPAPPRALKRPRPCLLYREERPLRPPLRRRRSQATGEA